MRLARHSAFWSSAWESLFKWQRLRLARVEATQPEHVHQVLEDARDLLQRQIVDDDALFRRAREILEAAAKTAAIDGFRIWSKHGIQRDPPMFRDDLDRFAASRRAHIGEWQDFNALTPREAADTSVKRVSDEATAAQRSQNWRLVPPLLPSFGATRTSSSRTVQTIPIAARRGGTAARRRL